MPPNLSVGKTMGSGTDTHCTVVRHTMEDQVGRLGVQYEHGRYDALMTYDWWLTMVMDGWMDGRMDGWME